MATITIPKIYLNFETSLASAMTSSATSFTLARSTDDDATTLSGTYFVTIDEGTSTEEHFLITLAGATATVVTRGLSRVDGSTNKSANQFAHNRGATVKITNAPLVLLARLLNGTDTFNTVNWLGVNSVSGLATPTSGETTKACNVAYANALAIAGAPDSAETVKGIVEKATTAESQAGTDAGSTTAPLFAKPSDIAKNTQNQQHSYATDTGSANVYAIALTPAITAYATGQKFTFKVLNANTGSSTLNVNALGTKAIQRYVNGSLQALSSNDILANMVVDVVYDGTRFLLLTPVATHIQSGTSFEVQAFFDNTDITGSEAEALTSGVSSDADTLHTHGELSFMLGVKNATRVKTYWTFDLPFDHDASAAAVWTATNMSNDGRSSWMTGTPTGAGTNSLITTNEVFLDPTGTVEGIRFGSGKDIIVEFMVKCSSIGTNAIGWGLMDTNVPVGTFNSIIASVNFCVDPTGQLYAHTGDDSNSTQTLISGITLTNLNTYRIEFNGGTDAKFYVNGVLKATITTTLPSGTTSAFNVLFGFGANTNTNVVSYISSPFFAIEK